MCLDRTDGRTRRELHAHNFSCEVRDSSQLNSPDALFYVVPSTDVEPIEFTCEVRGTTPSSSEAFFYVGYETGGRVRLRSRFSRRRR
jgi:hypothetical protein